MKMLFLSFLGISMMTLSFSAFSKKCNTGQVTFNFTMPSDNPYTVREILYYQVRVKGSGYLGWWKFHQFPSDTPYSPYDAEQLNYNVTWKKKCKLKREMMVAFKCDKNLYTRCIKTGFQQNNSGHYTFDIDLSKDDCRSYAVCFEVD